MSKGSGRRPGKGYEEGWERTFGMGGMGCQECHDTPCTCDAPQKFPELFKSCFDYSCPPGWEYIVCEACARFADLEQTVDIVQVKQKFGGLRLYTNQYTPEIERIVQDAEEQCAYTCERCGSRDGSVDKFRGTSHWISTLCGPCQVKRQEEIDKYK